MLEKEDEHWILKECKQNSNQKSSYLATPIWLLIMPVKPLLSLYSQRMLLKEYLIPKKGKIQSKIDF